MERQGAARHPPGSRVWRWCVGLSSFAFHDALELLDEVGQPKNRGTRAQGLPVWTRWISGPGLASRYVAEDAGLPGDSRTIANGDVSSKPGLTGDHDAVAHARRAGDAD